MVYIYRVSVHVADDQPWHLYTYNKCTRYYSMYLVYTCTYISVYIVSIHMYCTCACTCCMQVDLKSFMTNKSSSFVSWSNTTEDRAGMRQELWLTDSTSSRVWVLLIVLETFILQCTYTIHVHVQCSWSADILCCKTLYFQTQKLSCTIIILPLTRDCTTINIICTCTCTWRSVYILVIVLSISYKNIFTMT